MEDDLMWRILVSVTSQSICIITSYSLSLMTLSVVTGEERVVRELELKWMHRLTNSFIGYTRK